MRDVFRLLGAILTGFLIFPCLDVAAYCLLHPHGFWQAFAFIVVVLATAMPLIMLALLVSALVIFLTE